jgi:hypothetical protein
MGTGVATLVEPIPRIVDPSGVVYCRSVEQGQTKERDPGEMVKPGDSEGHVQGSVA